MSVKKQRINVSFEEAIAGFLKHIAKIENKPVAQVVRELALVGMEMREDLHLSRLAEKLDQEGTRT